MPTFEDKRYLHIVGTTAEWAADDIALGLGEIGVEDVGGGVAKIKVGDGVSAWSELGFVAGWTLAEIQAIVDDRIAALGVAVSTGSDDMNKLVRLDSVGKLDASMLPGSVDDLQYLARFFGYVNARDESPTTILGAGFVFKEGDHFINDRIGTYDVSWPGIGGQACADNHICYYRGVSFGFDTIVVGTQA